MHSVDDFTLDFSSFLLKISFFLVREPKIPIYLTKFFDPEQTFAPVVTKKNTLVGISLPPDAQRSETKWDSDDYR